MDQNTQTAYNTLLSALHNVFTDSESSQIADAVVALSTAVTVSLITQNANTVITTNPPSSNVSLEDNSGASFLTLF